MKYLLIAFLLMIQPTGGKPLVIVQISTEGDVEMKHLKTITEDDALDLLQQFIDKQKGVKKL